MHYQARTFISMANRRRRPASVLKVTADVQEDDVTDRPRKELRFNAAIEVVYIFGGDDEDPGLISGPGTIERHYFYGEAPDNCRNQIVQRSKFGIALYNRLIWLVGGRENYSEAPIWTACNYDPVENVWNHEVSHMAFRRCQPGVTEFHGSLYAIGGRGVSIALRSMESYNSDTDEWTVQPSPMRAARSDFGLAAIGSKLFAVGGLGSRYEPVPSVEFFQLGNSGWTIVTVRHEGLRGQCNLGVANDNIYVFGGTDAVNVIRYDPNNDDWRSMRGMPEHRSGPAVVNIDGAIYLFGGKTGDENSNLVDRFDPHSRVWHPLQPLIVPRYKGKAVVIREARSRRTARGTATGSV